MALKNGSGKPELSHLEVQARWGRGESRSCQVVGVSEDKDRVKVSAFGPDNHRSI